MRTVFLGTADFAVPVLRALAGSDHAPALVLTRPDRPRGRGRRLAPPPVAEAARELGLPVFQPERVNEAEAVAAVAAAAPEALALCAYGALIREPLLSLRPILNVHPSLLPRWRGAAPVERAVMAGDADTGVSIIRLVAELDAGPMALQAAEPIAPDDTFGTLAPRLAELGGQLLVRALDEDPPLRPQPEEGVTYAERIEAEDRRLEPRQHGAVELERQVRALTPHIGAFVEPDGEERLGVRRAWVVEADEAAGPGELRAEGERLLLTCAPGTLELVEVQPPGKRAMAAADYLRGRR
ncbi:MAG TPA: methionyl-tRNA formyltransferase [Solirubrobacteraceae bacterium]